MEPATPPLHLGRREPAWRLPVRLLRNPSPSAEMCLAIPGQVVALAEEDRPLARVDVPGVEVVGGDTKVVERGHGDGLFIVTTGLGRLDPRARHSPTSLRPGDRVLVSGRVGDHGSGVSMLVWQDAVPVHPAAAAAREVLVTRTLDVLADDPLPRRC